LNRSNLDKGMTTENKTRIIPPKRLGEIAKAKYFEIVKSLPPLDQSQLDMAAMLAEAHETYIQATAELDAHCAETGSLCCPGSTGQTQIHPAFKIQTQATNNYLNIAKALRLSIAKDSDKAPETNELNSILGVE
jgi:phage terminase small subunit